MLDKTSSNKSTDFDDGLAVGFILGRQKGKKNNSLNNDDWQPPDWWIPVPEPEPYEILVLVWVTSTNNSFGLSLVNSETGSGGEGALSCDWGDGTQTNIPAGVFWSGSISHKFEELGQYLIKITTTDELNVMLSSSENNCYLQIIKTGNNILLKSKTGYVNSPFSSRHRVKYIKINNINGIPFNETNYYFSANFALQKIELKKQMLGDIPDECFMYSTFKNLRQISLDGNSVNSVGKYAFADNRCLEKIILPNCISIGDYAFQNCYNLQEIVVADDCTFGTNCFKNCFSLYPRPDGSVN